MNGPLINHMYISMFIYICTLHNAMTSIKIDSCLNMMHLID